MSSPEFSAFDLIKHLTHVFGSMEILDVLLMLSPFMLFSDVTTGPSVRSWPDQMCFLTLAQEHTNTWRSNMNVCPTVRIPCFFSPRALLYY